MSTATAPTSLIETLNEQAKTIRRLRRDRQILLDGHRKIIAEAPAAEPKHPGRILSPDDQGRYAYQLGAWERREISRAAIEAASAPMERRT